MANADTPEHSSITVIMIVCSSYLYALTNELSISWASPVLKQLRIDHPDNPIGRSITTNEQEWLASLIYLGYMAGLIPYCYLSSKYGRKYTLLSLGVIHVIAFSLYMTGSLTCYYIGRFLNGIASSVGFIIFPMYIAEICSESDRGALLVSRQIFAGLGTVVAYACGNYMNMVLFNAFNLFFPLTFILTFATLGVESPYYYALNKKYDEAKQVYIELNTRDNENLEADEEIQEMQRTLEISETDTLLDFLREKHIQKSILVVFTLFIFQQLTGYIAFATYTEIIVKSHHSTIFIGIVVLIGSAFTTCFVDKFGRRAHLFASGAGIVIVEIALVVYYIFFHPDYYILVICITLFFLSYNIGLAFIPQIICAEILPQRIKFEVAAMAGVFGWGLAFFITKYYLQVNHIVMISIFLFCSIIQLVIIYKLVPETKKQSFRMIQGMLQIDANPIEE